MSEDLRIVSDPAQGQGASQRAARADAFTGYRARVSVPMDGPEVRRAVDKLNRVLDSGRPLRHDVPRGFYLNLRV
ncbi:MAG: hypothetical protein QGH73_05410 [Rhodospirillales bacterium]|jgi:hypothetical protein|nr:hypothetical protein [Rhodospirillaceae bacterium]MDP6428840.1 hypothetical protein [Rhodospirillales bacterium]MDP6643969.1 hypothetical protein [Rhodospirillales bacterium]MDP6841096.1 hypothetical protein [Rhodospirillales bacterium]|tara:strand:- start:682 stop:906 length:225 start_codon:yes stop_codon:yes gene_type:complete